MARDLYQRLKHLKKQKAERNDPALTAPGNIHTVAAVEGLAGWQQLHPLVFQKSEIVTVAGPGSSVLTSRTLCSRIRLADLCFMDTETTGLSGGAGTSVFLAGSGFYRDGTMVVTQTFLADFPGEPEFLSVVSKQLFGSPVWVSYNGKAFDTHLLRTRFLMNGMPFSVPLQLDLLYWARRLWRKRMGRCGLGDVEREILDISRPVDLPGSEIPERYFSFLRSRNADMLQPVFAHHLQDIVSLARIFFRIETLLGSVGKGGLEGEVDRVTLGRYLAMSGQEGAESLLRGVVDSPLPDETVEDRERCAVTLAQLHRRKGSGADIRAIWERLWNEGSFRGGVELAKYLEHREHRFDDAARIVLALISQEQSPGTLSLLEHRLHRLRRKSDS